MKSLCAASCMIAACSVVVSPVTAGWSVTPRGSVVLSAGAVSDIHEMSGVTYLGPAGGGLDRFAAIQDQDRRVIVFDVGFQTDGSIGSATAMSDITLSEGVDFEGIAYTGPLRNTIFASEEGNATRPTAVHEFELATGELTPTVVSIPAVFGFRRNNRGLESLTRSRDGQTMWTANEEALSIDGPEAMATNGTTVRLQRLDDDGVNVAAGPQSAYQVDPIHATTNDSDDRSGLADLAMLPDDTLLALERSAAATLPAFRSRIYEIDFAGATDVSLPTYDSGLDGTTYSSVAKNLLWSGQAGVGVLGSGENLEGLTLGPVLSSGNWVLLGVIDDGDLLSSNRVVSFELSLTGCSLAGDYNCSGEVDDADYRLWKNTFGAIDVLAADGNGNGAVDAADYTVWRDHLGESLGSGAAAGKANSTVPEPAAAVLLLVGVSIARTRRRLALLDNWPIAAGY